MSDDDEDADQRDRSWLAGNRAAWRELLIQALAMLGYSGDELERHSWILEREAAVAQLRKLCERFGDNDWPNDLHLADVIEKHLGRYLEDDE